MLKTEVRQAIDEVRDQFSGYTVTEREDGDGGAFVIVEGLDPGPAYKQRETWVGFRIGFQYPHADVYPHYVRGDLERVDGKGFGDGITRGHTFERRAAIQLSRRSNRLDANTDTAVLKLLKVMQWLENRP